jgi:hypothetical protein
MWMYYSGFAFILLPDSRFPWNRGAIACRCNIAYDVSAFALGLKGKHNDKLASHYIKWCF